MRRIYIGLLMLGLVMVGGGLCFLFNLIVEDDIDNTVCQSCPEPA